MDEYIQQVKSIIFSGKDPYEFYDVTKDIANLMEVDGANVYRGDAQRIERITAVSNQLTIQQYRLLTIDLTDFKCFLVYYMFENTIVVFKKAQPDLYSMSRSHLVYKINDKLKDDIIEKLYSYPFIEIDKKLKEEHVIPMQFMDYIKPSSVKSARN